MLKALCYSYTELIDNWFFSSNIHWYPKGGLRARFLPGYINLAAEFNQIIVFCGNNDLSDHPFKASLVAEELRKVVASLLNFKTLVNQKNPAARVSVVGLIPRPDVPKHLIQETNDLLYEAIPESYFSPRNIRSKDFSNDNVHFNSVGILHAARLFTRIINSVL